MRTLLAGLVFIPTLLSAQDYVSRAPSVPQLVVSAQGEVRIAPDRATIHIAVQTRARTAAAAASENAQRQQRVIAAIRALGIAQEHISTVGYTVSPEHRYEPNREPVIVGYNVTNTVVVDVQRIEQVGPVIDASLGAGANQISGLRFYSSTADEARREAMARAIAGARRDAEVMARAAGGSVGELLEASVGAAHMPPPMPVMRMESLQAAADTPISPGQQAVIVTVQTRWRFEATR